VKAKKIPFVHFFQDKKKEFRWQLRAPNGRIIAVSGEGYQRKGNEIRAWNATVRLMARLLSMTPKKLG
jgi:uncharacterized protein YegP (UPF0339 family)